MAVTIKDVAALAGVSPSTVSRTCKNNPSISEETKERVRKAMAELGYEPNFQASNLASQNSRTIGIILPASAKEVYENSFYLEAIQGISHYCNGRQYMTKIVPGQDEAEILDAVRYMSRSGKVDGFIVLYSKKEDPVIDYLFNEGLLYILIGKATQYTNQTIYIDNDNTPDGVVTTDANGFMLIKNISTETWTVETPSGKVKTVAPQEILPVKEGLKITFRVHTVPYKAEIKFMSNN